MARYWLLPLILFCVFPCHTLDLHDIFRSSLCTSVGGFPGVCLPLSTCPEVYDDLPEATNMACLLPSRAPGVCCSPLARTNVTVNSHNALGAIEDILGSSLDATDLSGPSLDFWTQMVTPDVLQFAKLEGLRKFLVRERIEEELQNEGVVVQAGTSEYLHQFFLKPFPEALEQSRHAMIQDESNRALLSRLQTKRIMARVEQLSRQGAFGSGAAQCPARPCSMAAANSKYRAVDGGCNNLRNGNWGRSFTALNRLLRPQYADGFSQPRIALDGRPLPSARLVSSSCVSDVNRPSKMLTLVLMNWGQFINHDITLTALNAMSNGAGIKCCSGMQANIPFLRHEECFPIAVPSDDPFYASHKHTCMEFVRSLPAASDRKSCEFGFRDQLNEVSSFIDGSVIYGSSANLARALRSFRNGRLRTVKCFGAEYLPFLSGNSTSCNRPFQQYLTGDIRATEQAHLSALHTVFVREHNRIAEELGKLNPHWKDEVLYQETRRIIGAVMQHVTFNEYLPIVLGKQLVTAVRLLPLKDGYTNDYNPDVNPGILNEFSAAANRYGHSLIQGIFQMLDPDDKTEGTLRVRDQFAMPVPLYFPKNLDRVIRGVTKQPVQQVDASMTQEVTQHLYQFNRPFGLDLAAANIQRGRDHGLPGYNAYRQFCGLGAAKTFDDFKKDMDASIADRLARIYRQVNDVDLWIGSISEKPLGGALVGPTLACLLVKQYWRLKIGDRYWYEYNANPGRFSTTQLAEIRKTSLSRILCDNGDKIHKMQPLVFIQPADWYRMSNCGTWLEQTTCRNLAKKSICLNCVNTYDKRECPGKLCNIQGKYSFEPTCVMRQQCNSKNESTTMERRNSRCTTQHCSKTG